MIVDDKSFKSGAPRLSMSMVWADTAPLKTSFMEAAASNNAVSA